MNRLTLGCFLAAFLCFVSPIYAAKYETQYRSMYQTEKLGFYANARQGYFDLCKDLLNKKYTRSTEDLRETLPVLVSAAFRLGVMTSKTSFYDVHSLGYQLDMFKSTDEILQDVILVMVQLHQKHPTLIPKNQFSMLFFARAYNRIGWSSKLVFAIPWKQYIVHPPSDCIMLLYSAADDLTYLKESDILTSESLKKLDKTSLEFRTYQLTNLEDNPDELASIFSKRYTQNILPTVSFIRSQKVIDALDLTRHHTTYQGILSEKNSLLFEVFGEVTQKIGIN